MICLAQLKRNGKDDFKSYVRVRKFNTRLPVGMFFGGLVLGLFAGCAS